MAKMNWGRTAKDKNAERYGSFRASETYAPGKRKKKKKLKKKLAASKEVRTAVAAQILKRRGEAKVYRSSGTSETPLFDQLGIESPVSPVSTESLRAEKAAEAARVAHNKKEERLNHLIELHHKAVEERKRAEADRLERARQQQAAAVAARMARRQSQK